MTRARRRGSYLINCGLRAKVTSDGHYYIAKLNSVLEFSSRAKGEAPQASLAGPIVRLILYRPGKRRRQLSHAKPNLPVEDRHLNRLVHAAKRLCGAHNFFAHAVKIPGQV